MALNVLQARLEHLYEVAVEHRVEDFLIRDRALATRLAGPSRPPVREQLLVHADAEGLSVSLYVDADVLAYLERDDPIARLDDADLDAVCVALEGVSHFLYLAWRAGQDRRVSQLELELQAEVDKYVLLYCVLAEQQGRDGMRRLGERLFETVRYDERLTGQERRRYEAANRYAARWCSALERCYGAGGQYGGWLRALRRFYRLGQQDKLRAIDRGLN